MWVMGIMIDLTTVPIPGCCFFGGNILHVASWYVCVTELLWSSELDNWMKIWTCVSLVLRCTLFTLPYYPYPRTKGQTGKLLFFPGQEKGNSWYQIKLEHYNSVLSCHIKVLSHVIAQQAKYSYKSHTEASLQSKELSYVTWFFIIVSNLCLMLLNYPTDYKQWKNEDHNQWIPPRIFNSFVS